MKIIKNKKVPPRLTRIKSQLGVTMVFLVTSVVTLVIIAGLLINIGANALKIEDSRSLARTAALVSVKEFFKSRKNGSDPDNALEIVVNGLNNIVSGSDSHVNAERFRDLKIDFQVGGPNNSSLSQSHPTNSFGVVTAGRYDPRIIDQNARFTPVNVNSSSPEINAIKVDLMLGSDSIYNRFARSFLGGGGGFKRSSAIAVFQPSNIFFLVDISGSAVAQSHIRRRIEHQEKGAPRGGLLSVRCAAPEPSDPNFINSYLVNSSTANSVKSTSMDPLYCSPLYRPGQHGPATAGSAGSAIAETDPITGVSRYYSTLATDDYCLSATARVSSTNYCQWKFIRDYHSGTATDNGYFLNQNGSTILPAGYHYKMGDTGTADTTSHFINNYLDKTVNPSNLSSGAHPAVNEIADEGGIYRFKPFGGRFMIDKVSLDKGYAQPLTDILKAINFAVSEIDARGIPGDSVGSMFFERFPYVSRTLKLSTNLNNLSSLTTNIPSDTSSNSLIDLGIFPSDEQFTDLGMGLEVAYKQIMDSEMRKLGLRGNDQVIYIGDGLTNCTPFPNPELDADGDGMFDYDDIYGIAACCWGNSTNNCTLPYGSANSACTKFPNQASMTAAYANNPVLSSGCTDTYSQYQQSLNYVRGILANKYLSEQIKFNVIHIGKNAGAHTVGQSNGSGGCITNPSQLRKGGFTPVLPPDKSSSDKNSQIYANQSASSPFFQAAFDMYSLTASTGGLYSPVLSTESNCQQVCDGNTRITCSSSSQESQLAEIMSDLIRDPDPFRLYDSD